MAVGQRQRLYSDVRLVEQRPPHHKAHDHNISSITASYIVDRINSKRMCLFTSGGSRHRRNTNRRATMDPTGEMKSPSTSGIPDVHRTLYCTSRKQQLSLRVRISKATANTVIATAKGNIRQGRLMAGHGGLYSTTKLR